MKKTGLLIALLGSSMFFGCAHNNVVKENNTTKATTTQKSVEVKKIVKKDIDNCEIDYQKCNMGCSISTLNQAQWKKVICESKCKTIYGACKTKQKTMEGVDYIKEKVSN